MLCDKPEEAVNWHKYAIEAGRKEDILFLSEEKFNFLSYESERKGGGDTEHMTYGF